MIFSTDIDQAITILTQGGLVAIPTETVYGLAADAQNDVALKKIFAAKERPTDHPLIVHIASSAQLNDWAREIPAEAYLLTEHFWPGPLTLVLKKKLGVSDLITGQQDTVGLRAPAHPLTQKLLKKFNRGIAAPSANKFGRISPTTAEAVYEELGTAVDLILTGGQSTKGLESTILDLSQNQPTILRPGIISRLAIEKILNKKVLLTQKNSPRVSGALESHYAPRTKTSLFSGKLSADILTDKSIAIIKFFPDIAQYSHDLYQTLRELDKQNLKLILIEQVPETDEWDAVRDRLQRMCS